MIVAVDTGGTKTLIATFDRDGTTNILEKFPTPRDTTEYAKTVADQILKHCEPGEVDAICVAAPGPIDSNILQRAKNLGWQTVDISRLLASRFPSTPIYIGNDADLAGISEARRLGDQPGRCLYVTLSTGIGAGLSYDGKLLPGFGRFEAGWMHLLYDGKFQEWEDFASGSSFYKRYGQYGSEVNDPDKWHDFAKRASSGLAVLIPMFQPNTVIIGGSMGTHFTKYSSFLRQELESVIPSFMAETDIVQAKHPEEAVIYGCYYYAIDQLAIAEAA